MPGFSPSGSGPIGALDAPVSGGGFVSADLAGTYSVRQAVTGSLAGTYSVRQAVTGSLAGTYSVRTAVYANLAGSYTVNGLAITAPPVTFPAASVPAAHRVVFPGGTKVVTFPGSNKTVRF